MELKLFLVKEGNYLRTFIHAGMKFQVTYVRYSILKEEETFKISNAVREITERSYLNQLLSSMIEENKKILISERMAKLLQVAFRNSNKWKIYSTALDILKEKGLDSAMDYLEDKLSIFYLNEKLEKKTRY